MDVKKAIALIHQVSYGMLIVGFIFYILSKVVSAQRLNLFLLAEGISIRASLNLKLYFQGMFYNLFLPGGIGGDGYKAVFLKKAYGFSLKKILQALILDRVSGVLALMSLCCIFYLIALSQVSVLINVIMTITLFFLFPVSYLLTSLIFKKHAEYFVKSSLYSFLVQGLQVISALFVLLSMGLQNSYFLYLGIFLVSSLVAIAPITIGGIGARELAFLFAAKFVGIDLNLAIMFSLLFLMINVVSSLPGIFIQLPTAKTIKPTAIQSIE
jgi:glycosyltransferase 2 family protein